jgi:predicted TIM-barrel fold metal-dependent hydrolase
MTVDLGYSVIDADNHYYEPRDAFTRYIDPKHRDLAIHVVTDDQGEEQILVGDKPYTFTSPSYFSRAGKPGSLRERMRLIKAGGVIQDAASLEIPLPPEFTNRDARLAVMDDQDIEASIMLPTLGVCVEHFMRDDPVQMYANLTAFNRWLDETWGFNHANRIFAPPLLDLLDLELAIAQLDDVIERGARVVHLRPAPVDGRSPADPYYDAWWARVAEAGVVVAFHISECGYNELVSQAWGEKPNPPVRQMSAWQWTCSYGDRPIMDTMAALVLHNLFGRFPTLKVASIEHGSLWVSYLLKAMDKYRGMGRHGEWLGGPVTDRPSRIFKEHVYVSPYHEENLLELVDLIGADRVLFGSDYPHTEGLAHPLDYADRLEGMDPVAVRQIMRDNTGELLGIV